MKSYFYNFGVALDQCINVLLAGDPDETLSSRAHRMRLSGHKHWGWTADAIDQAFFWQPGHCAMAFDSEVNRQQSRAIARLLAVRKARGEDQ